MYILGADIQIPGIPLSSDPGSTPDYHIYDTDLIKQGLAAQQTPGVDLIIWCCFNAGPPSMILTQHWKQHWVIVSCFLVDSNVDVIHAFLAFMLLAFTTKRMFFRTAALVSSQLYSVWLYLPVYSCLTWPRYLVLKSRWRPHTIRGAIAVWEKYR